MRAHTGPLDRRTQRNFMTLSSPITVPEGVDVSTWDVELVGTVDIRLVHIRITSRTVSFGTTYTDAEIIQDKLH